MMKNHPLFSMLAVGLCTWVSLAIPSCQKTIIEEEAQAATLHADGGGTGGNQAVDPCYGIAEYSLTANVISVAAYPAYDVAIKVEGGSPSLSSKCFCKNNHSEVLVYKNRNLIQYVGVANSEDLTDPIDIIYEYDASILVDSGEVSTTFNWESERGNVVLFKFFPGHIPAPSQLENFVMAAGGLCLVDNLHDPKTSIIRTLPSYSQYSTGN